MARMRRERAMPAGVGEEEGGGMGIDDDDGDDASLSLNGNKPPLMPNRHGGGMIVRQKPTMEAAIDLRRACACERKARSRANQTDESARTR